MRKHLLMALVAWLAVATTGCNVVASLATLSPFRGKKKDSVAKDVLGVSDDRIKELDSEALDTEMARPRSGLRLSIHTDKTAYQIGEPIVVDLRLENVTAGAGAEGARDIPVYFEPIARGQGGAAVEWLFNFQIRTEADQRLVYQSPKIRVPEAERADYYHYVVLPPQAFVGRRFIFWPTRVRALNRPGTYGLLAGYQVDEDSAYVIINRNFTAQQVELLGTKLAYARVWTGQVFANRVTFDVKRKKWLGIF